MRLPEVGVTSAWSYGGDTATTSTPRPAAPPMATPAHGALFSWRAVRPPWRARAWHSGSVDIDVDRQVHGVAVPSAASTASPSRRRGRARPPRSSRSCASSGRPSSRGCPVPASILGGQSGRTGHRAPPPDSDMSRRIGVPWPRSDPNWCRRRRRGRVVKWMTESAPTPLRAVPVMSGRAMVWSPPRTTGMPAAGHQLHRLLERHRTRCAPSILAGGHEAIVAGVHHSELDERVDAESERRTSAVVLEVARQPDRLRTEAAAGAGWCRRRTGAPTITAAAPAKLAGSSRSARARRRRWRRVRTCCRASSPASVLHGRSLPGGERGAKRAGYYFRNSRVDGDLVASHPVRGGAAAPPRRARPRRRARQTRSARAARRRRAWDRRVPPGGSRRGAASRSNRARAWRRACTPRGGDETRRDARCGGGARSGNRRVRAAPAGAVAPASARSVRPGPPRPAGAIRTR